MNARPTHQPARPARSRPASAVSVVPLLAHLPRRLSVTEGAAFGPLTSESPLADTAHAPLTSEPPLTDEAPLTSEPTTPAAAAG
ncbi:hypothetical protein ACIBEA_36400 [Streptomyces sp. NPDC051555]|uniref:hypothetical protein n=1 Tax=Streptomyces sp. NPDC051555 TaxID=3365657 RepID=UPI0037BB921A